MTGKTNSDSLRGNLGLIVLSVLTEERLYGYLIQQRLAEASGGLVNVKAGTLYPILHRLEADKLIRSRWDAGTGRRRKWYELTASGRNNWCNEPTSGGSMPTVSARCSHRSLRLRRKRPAVKLRC